MRASGAGRPSADETSDGVRPDAVGPATRERILDALTEVVLEGGLADFSVQHVADRAGVSHRTVYRYFPSREALLIGLVERSEARMAELGGIFEVPSADGLADAVAHNLAVFDQLADEVEAGVRFAIATGVSVPQREQRTGLFHERVAQALEDHDEGEVAAVAAIVRLLAGSRAWLALRDDSDLDAEHRAAAVAWAVRTLLRAAQEGRGPVSERPSGQGARER